MPKKIKRSKKFFAAFILTFYKRSFIDVFYGEKEINKKITQIDAKSKI